MNRREFMASMAVGAALPLLSKADTSIKPTRFKRIELPGLEPRPDFWKVRPQEIIDICERATKCSRKEIIAYTPLGYPVYALFYGDFNPTFHVRMKKPRIYWGFA